MNYSDEFLIQLCAALAVPIALLTILNWIFRKRGGIAKGWTGAVFIGICWVASLLLILKRVS